MALNSIAVFLSRFPSPLSLFSSNETGPLGIDSIVATETLSSHEISIDREIVLEGRTAAEGCNNNAANRCRKKTRETVYPNGFPAHHSFHLSLFLMLSAHYCNSLLFGTLHSNIIRSNVPPDSVFFMPTLTMVEFRSGIILNC